MGKHTGGNEFKQPLVEEQMELGDFLRQAQGILDQGLESRMYLQETLSGHAEMADEFVTWNWEFLIRASTSCQWGLPDSNELFIGMPGVETPLHFDERENLFFQVRGRKEFFSRSWTTRACTHFPRHMLVTDSPWWEIHELQTSQRFRAFDMSSGIMLSCSPEICCICHTAGGTGCEVWTTCQLPCPSGAQHLPATSQRVSPKSSPTTC